ncbi:MAG TPA: AAA family ATPase [Alphaproteobacteria bacterium]|nr:AAA family ATPase [Alphaproteobacteria bacterium]
MPEELKLSPQQGQAFDNVMAWHQTDEKRYILAGYAGAGKTTIAKYIAEAIGIEDVIFCAYTGKAANVLREKGCTNSSTIHGAIYTLINDEDLKPRFILDQESPVKFAKLVIVDEYSMLPEEIIDDIEKLAKKVLYLGDPFQLPPVHGECPLNPDFFLEEIHRQALESPIIRYATDVRAGKQLKFVDLPEFHYAPRASMSADAYEQADQIIVGYNKTRTAWNERFRQKLGLNQSIYPVAGDKLICTRNNHELGLFNGMIGYAKSDSYIEATQQLRLDFEDFKGLEVWDGNFRGAAQPDRAFRKLDRFDFAYAITCHKSQGSEFDSVLVYNQPIGSDAVERQRWLYTAITRAKKKLTLVEPA